MAHLSVGDVFNIIEPHGKWLTYRNAVHRME
jgi:hypothetical protein